MRLPKVSDAVSKEFFPAPEHYLLLPQIGLVLAIGAKKNRFSMVPRNLLGWLYWYNSGDRAYHLAKTKQWIKEGPKNLARSFKNFKQL